MMRHLTIPGLFLAICLCCTQKTAPVSHGDTPGRVVVSRVVMGKRVRTSQIHSGYVKVTAPTMSSHMTYALTITDTGFSAEIRMPDEGDTFHVEVGFRDSAGSLLGWDRETIVYGFDQTTATAAFAIEAAARALATLSVTPDTTVFLAEDGSLEMSISVDTTDAYGEIVSFMWDTTGDSTWDVIEPAEGRLAARRTVGSLPAGAGTLLCGFMDSEGDSAVVPVSVYVSTPPNDPVLIMPLDGRRGAWKEFDNGTGSVELRFTTSDPDTAVDSLTVRVLAGPARAGLAPVTAVTESTAVIEGLTTGSTCYWEIVVTDRAGLQKSLPGSFQTFPPAPEGMVGIPAKGFESPDNPDEIFEFDFWMDMTEVTQYDYERQMSPLAPEANTDPSLFKGALLPVHQVSAFDAFMYCNERSKSEGLDTVYVYNRINRTVNSNPVYYKSLGASPYVQNDEILPKPGYRLAAVSEWQFAYRAGTDGDYYWAGDRYMELLAKEYAWFGGSVEDPQVTPYGPDTVAHRRPNPWGLFDMAGNVAEFVRGADNSCLLGTIAAGGSWGEELRYLTYASVDNMGCAVSHSHTETFGFRCVRIIKD